MNITKQDVVRWRYRYIYQGSIGTPSLVTSPFGKKKNLRQVYLYTIAVITGIHHFRCIYGCLLVQTILSRYIKPIS